MGTKLIQDLELAFDVGHSSIGWAILQAAERASSRTETPRINILGCGVVTFGADDCLASERRDYRRQRRHARSTRQHISQMEKLLAHNLVTHSKQKPAKGTFAGFLKKRLLLQVSGHKHGERTACVPNFVLIPI